MQHPRAVSRTVHYLVGLLALACGSKSALLIGSAASDDGGAGAGGAGAGGAGAGGASAGGTSSGGGAGAPEAGVDAPPPLPDCLYVQHGEPIVIFTYGEGVHTPTLAPITTTAPARIAVGLIHEHFWHPELRVAELTVGAAWPEGVSTTHGMLLYGIDAHAPGQLVPSTNGPGELALLYFHADEASPNVTPGVMFRRFDTGAWKPFDEVFVEKLGGYAYSLAAGPSLGKGMGWANLGYGMTWRSATSGDAGSPLVATRVGVSDASGNVIAGPVDVAPASAYPGIGATIAWTGQSYVLASNARPCAASSPDCANRLTLARLEPGVGSAAKLVETSVQPPAPGLRARTPLLRSFAGATWAVWREQKIDAKPGEDVPSRLHLASVNAVGQLGSDVWQADAHPDAGAELLVSDQGVLLLWGERLDTAVQPHQVGHSRLRLKQLSKTGGELQELDLPTTSLTSGTAYSVTTLAEPRALLVAWTSQEPKPSGHAQAHLARFDCVPQ